jgi:hypothetical protein
MLAWSMLHYEAGYKTADEYEYGLENVKWGTDYLLKVRIIDICIHNQQLTFVHELSRKIMDTIARLLCYRLTRLRTNCMPSAVTAMKTTRFGVGLRTTQTVRGFR